HEFDFGPDFYADYIEAYREAGGTAPFLSANTDVSAEPRLAELAAGGAIAPSTVLEEQGEEIGVVGALTPQLPAISSPRGVVVDLTDEGVDKIVLISHLQDIGNERALVSELRDVDVVIAGGGGEVQAGPDTPLVPGDTVTEDPQTGEPMGYPLWAQDSAGTE